MAGRQYIGPMSVHRPPWATALIRSALPSTCAVCGRWPAQPVCRDCLARFGTRPMVEGLAPGPLVRCVAAVRYAYPWNTLLARLKFHDEPGWAGPLARLMAQAGRHDGLLASCDALVPVPLSPLRLAERGYNQAWELARRLDRPALPQALLRCLEGPPQRTLDRAARLRQLHGAFLVHPRARAAVSGRHLLLVDDVVTTGATVQAAATALHQAGAASVTALVLAATPAPAGAQPLTPL